MTGISLNVFADRVDKCSSFHRRYAQLLTGKIALLGDNAKRSIPDVRRLSSFPTDGCSSVRDRREYFAQVFAIAMLLSAACVHFASAQALDNARWSKLAVVRSDCANPQHY